MSGRLVGEVVEWLCSPAGQALDLSHAERNVLFIIAERADEKTREMWRHRGDDRTLLERICVAARLSQDGASNVFKKLSRKGLEVRIPRRDLAGNPVRARDGRLIFAHHGQAMQFRLPELPASVELPRSPVTEPPFPVDNPPGSPVVQPPFEPEARLYNRPSGSKAGPATALGGSKGGCTTAPNPSKENPSTTDPSTPKDPSATVPVEDRPPAAATPPAGTSHHMGYDSEYQAAVVTLTRFPDFGEQFITQAKAELGEDADRQQLFIRAAQFASEGLPA